MLGPRSTRHACARDRARSRSDHGSLRKSSSLRRWRFVGRPGVARRRFAPPRLRCRASSSRAAMLAGVFRYRSAASAAPPRRSDSAEHRRRPTRARLADRRRRSPARTACAGFTRSSRDARLAGVDRLRRERARLVEPRGPQPLVEAHAVGGTWAADACMARVTLVALARREHARAPRRREGVAAIAELAGHVRRCPARRGSTPTSARPACAARSSRARASRSSAKRDGGAA